MDIRENKLYTSVDLSDYPSIHSSIHQSYLCPAFSVSSYRDTPKPILFQGGVLSMSFYFGGLTFGALLTLEGTTIPRLANS